MQISDLIDSYNFIRSKRYQKLSKIDFFDKEIDIECKTSWEFNPDAQSLSEALLSFVFCPVKTKMIGFVKSDYIKDQFSIVNPAHNTNLSSQILLTQDKYGKHYIVDHELISGVRNLPKLKYVTN